MSTDHHAYPVFDLDDDSDIFAPQPAAQQKIFVKVEDLSVDEFFLRSFADTVAQQQRAPVANFDDLFDTAFFDTGAADVVRPTEHYDTPSPAASYCDRSSSPPPADRPPTPIPSSSTAAEAAEEEIEKQTKVILRLMRKRVVQPETNYSRPPVVSKERVPEEEEGDEEEEEEEEYESESEDEGPARVHKKMKTVARPRKGVYATKHKNLGFRTETLDVIRGSMAIGMPLVATMHEEIKGTKLWRVTCFVVVFTELSVGENRGDINKVTMHIPRFNDQGVDICRLLHTRYDPDGVIHMHQIPDTDVYEFSAPIKVRLNIYAPSQRRGDENARPGGYENDLCFRYNSARGAGSTRMMNTSMVVYMPLRDKISLYGRRQRICLDVVERNTRRVKIEFGAGNFKCALNAILARYAPISNSFTFVLNASETSALPFRIQSCRQVPTQDSDVLTVINDNKFIVDGPTILTRTDEDSRATAVFRCVLAYLAPNRLTVDRTLPVTANVFIY